LPSQIAACSAHPVPYRHCAPATDDLEEGMRRVRMAEQNIETGRFHCAGLFSLCKKRPAISGWTGGNFGGLAVISERKNAGISLIPAFCA